MAERRKPRRKREELDEKPSKVQYAIAKYLKAHLPVKKATLLNHKVDYFTASKAIDCLLDSPWAKSSKKEISFTSRESVGEFLELMIHYKFFHRARKIIVEPKKDLKKKEVGDKKEGKKKKDDNGGTVEDSKDKKGKKGEKKETDEKKKEKRKIKLDMHLDQCFKDGNEAYVWIYDPVPTKAWVIGGLLVIGAIVVCLFPLWPQSVRKGVYYLSIAAAGFLVVILVLAVIRVVVFCLVWLLTMGHHHLWLLPNLTEDVGFFESFWPLYKYEYHGASEDSKDDKEKKDNNKGSPEHSEGTKGSAGDKTDDNEDFEVLEAQDIEEVQK